MSSDSFSHDRGLAVAFVVVLGVSIAGFHHSALARVSDHVEAGRLLGSEPTAAATVSADDALLNRGGARPDTAIVIADRKGHRDHDDDDNNDNGHKNGKGNRSGHNDNGNGGNDGGRNGNGGNWNGNGGDWKGKSGNWNGNGGDWKGKSGNWNGNGGNNGNWKNGNNGNWNKGGNYGNNWNKGGNNHWSNNNHWNNNWNKGWNNRAYVRGWSNRPYYGEFFGGVVLGSLLAATGVGVVPYSPAPELCWYWADPYMYRGYWDYCY
jgi:hypothetical protein